MPDIPHRSANDPQERRRRADHSTIHKVVNSDYVTALSRLGILAIGFIGTLVWGDITEQGKQIAMVLNNQAAMGEWKIAMERRVDSSETAIDRIWDKLQTRQ